MNENEFILDFEIEVTRETKNGELLCAALWGAFL